MVGPPAEWLGENELAFRLANRAQGRLAVSQICDEITLVADAAISSGLRFLNPNVARHDVERPATFIGQGYNRLPAQSKPTCTIRKWAHRLTTVMC